MASKKRVKAGTSKASAADKRALFVEAYCTNGGNATVAAKTAGYSAKTAGSAGGRLLKDVAIAAAIRARRGEALAEAEQRTGVKASEVLAELGALVFSDLSQAFDQNGGLLPPHKWPEGVKRAISKVKVVEMAGGMEVSGKDGVQHVPMYTKEVSIYDKNSAIDKAMKHLGLYERDNEQQPPAAVIHAPGAKTVKFAPLKARDARG